VFVVEQIIRAKVEGEWHRETGDDILGARLCRPPYTPFLIYLRSLCDHEAFCYYEEEVSRHFFWQVRLVKKNAIVVLIFQGKKLGILST
jgi:hypothetical protein